MEQNMISDSGPFRSGTSPILNFLIQIKRLLLTIWIGLALNRNYLGTWLCPARGKHRPATFRTPIKYP
jgi:hypothetical protein